jgi:hypothetical protein
VVAAGVPWHRNRAFDDGARPIKEEEDPFPPVRTGQVSAIALSVNAPTQDTDGRWAGKYPNAKSLLHGARLVFARPPYADVPLWNAQGTFPGS